VQQNKQLRREGIKVALAAVAKLIQLGVKAYRGSKKVKKVTNKVAMRKKPGKGSIGEAKDVLAKRKNELANHAKSDSTTAHKIMQTGVKKQAQRVQGRTANAKRKAKGAEKVPKERTSEAFAYHKKRVFKHAQELKNAKPVNKTQLSARIRAVKAKLDTKYNPSLVKELGRLQKQRYK